MKRIAIIVGLAIFALAATAIGAGALSIDPGSRRINGDLTVVGNSTLTGTTTHTGVTTFAAIDAGLVKTNILDAGRAHIVDDLSVGDDVTVTGDVTVGATLGVTGVTTLAALDAGINSKVGGVAIATGKPQDGGVVTPLMQWGYQALSSDEVAITFTTAFSAIPSCTCTHVQTTNANACGIKSGTVATVSAVTFAVTSGGTDLIYWQCMGDK